MAVQTGAPLLSVIDELSPFRSAEHFGAGALFRGGGGGGCGEMTGAGDGSMQERGDLKKRKDAWQR